MIVFMGRLLIRMSDQQIIYGHSDASIEWVSGEETNQVQSPFEVVFQGENNFDNIRLITTLPITPEIMEELEEGLPNSEDDILGDIDLSFDATRNFTENMCDKLVWPHYIFNSELEPLPNPFPNGKFLVLTQNMYDEETNDLSNSNSASNLDLNSNQDHNSNHDANSNIDNDSNADVDPKSNSNSE